jgi:hypothetical protein
VLPLLLLAVLPLVVPLVPLLVDTPLLVELLLLPVEPVVPLLLEPPLVVPLDVPPCPPSPTPSPVVPLHARASIEKSNAKELVPIVLMMPFPGAIFVPTRTRRLFAGFLPRTPVFAKATGPFHALDPGPFSLGCYGAE